MSYDNAQNANIPGGIMLGGRIEILPSMPLPELNSVGGPAYAARLRTDAAFNLCAIICQSGMPPRLDAIGVARTVDNPGVMRLIEGGIISWVDGTSVYALIYQRPTAPRMTASIDETHPVLSEDSVSQHFVAPMIHSLIALSNAGLVHNAIRPTNIFWRIGNASPPQIGECLSAPAGLGQPVLFEPIERALAMPLARGQGFHADDCYAFGMCLALLVLGHNPFAGMDDAAIIDLKMQRGTFAAMIGSNRLSSTHIEILRGLLADDPKQRWTATHLEQWLSGRRLTPKSSDAGKRASRHFDFMGREYWQMAPLACALAAHVGEAAKIIENDSLNKWLRRSLGDEERANDAQAVVENLKQSGKSGHYEDQLVARTCIVMDQTAPIRYRGIATMPAGIASLLAEAATTATNIPVLSEIIASQLVGLWVEMQKDINPEQVALVQSFDRMKGLIEKNILGGGVERVTYELNPGIPCLSALLRGHYVTSPKMLLPALERVAGSGNRPRDPIDRHIAAFLAVRDKRGESVFTPIAAPEGSVKRGIGLLTLFSELQYRHGPESLPQLAAWLSPVVEPALRRFLSKALRDNLQKLVKEAVAAGDLGAMLRLIDDPRRIERDRQEFLAARILYLNTQKEIVGLESKLSHRDSVVRASGKPMAASISSFLAIILVCAAVLRALFEALFQ